MAGIGATLLPQPDGTVVFAKIRPFGPADLAKIEAGTELLAVFSKGKFLHLTNIAENERVEAAADAIRGEIGTPLRLLVLPKGVHKSQEVTLIRGRMSSLFTLETVITKLQKLVGKSNNNPDTIVEGIVSKELIAAYQGVGKEVAELCEALDAAERRMGAGTTSPPIARQHIVSPVSSPPSSPPLTSPLSSRGLSSPGKASATTTTTPGNHHNNNNTMSQSKTEALVAAVIQAERRARELSETYTTDVRKLERQVTDLQIENDRLTGYVTRLSSKANRSTAPAAENNKSENNKNNNNNNSIDNSNAPTSTPSTSSSSSSSRALISTPNNDNSLACATLSAALNAAEERLDKARVAHSREMELVKRESAEARHQLQELLTQKTMEATKYFEQIQSYQQQLSEAKAREAELTIEIDVLQREVESLKRKLASPTNGNNSRSISSPLSLPKSPKSPFALSSPATRDEIDAGNKESRKASPSPSPTRNAAPVVENAEATTTTPTAATPLTATSTTSSSFAARLLLGGGKGGGEDSVESNNNDKAPSSSSRSPKPLPKPTAIALAPPTFSSSLRVGDVSIKGSWKQEGRQVLKDGISIAVFIDGLLQSVAKFERNLEEWTAILRHPLSAEIDSVGVIAFSPSSSSSLSPSQPKFARELHLKDAIKKLRTDRKLETITGWWRRVEDVDDENIQQRPSAPRLLANNATVATTPALILAGHVFDGYSHSVFPPPSPPLADSRHVLAFDPIVVDFAQKTLKRCIESRNIAPVAHVVAHLRAAFTPAALVCCFPTLFARISADVRESKSWKSLALLESVEGYLQDVSDWSDFVTRFVAPSRERLPSWNDVDDEESNNSDSSSGRGGESLAASVATDLMVPLLNFKINIGGVILCLCRCFSLASLSFACGQIGLSSSGGERVSDLIRKLDEYEDGRGWQALLETALMSNPEEEAEIGDGSATKAVPARNSWALLPRIESDSARRQRVARAARVAFGPAASSLNLLDVVQHLEACLTLPNLNACLKAIGLPPISEKATANSTSLVAAAIRAIDCRRAWKIFGRGVVIVQSSSPSSLIRGKIPDISSRLPQDGDDSGLVVIAIRNFQIAQVAASVVDTLVEEDVNVADVIRLAADMMHPNVLTLCIEEIMSSKNNNNSNSNSGNSRSGTIFSPSSSSVEELAQIITNLKGWSHFCNVLDPHV